MKNEFYNTCTCLHLSFITDLFLQKGFHPYGIVRLYQSHYIEVVHGAIFMDLGLVGNIEKKNWGRF